ncbi:MAG: family 1 glycosylhydrolase [Saprospiraceae bacterium]|nr:glycoside hydrolase family 1 protein [Lewinella sp.]
MLIQFPRSFFWGSSTSAPQIETPSDHNWRGFVARDGSVFDRTIDHEKKREEDLEYIVRFGQVYRCGIDWARLQPEPFGIFDPEVVDEYQEFFAHIRDEGMNIMLVLHHFTNPIWFEERGGWLEENNISAFVDFAQQCITYFGSYVSYWNTFNEPNVYAAMAYLLGQFPPQKKSLRKADRVLNYLGQAHRIVHDLIKDQYPFHQVGISLNTVWFEAIHPLGRLPAYMADRWFHRKASRYFSNVDFWGLSYYAYVPFNPKPITEINKPGKLARLGIKHDKMWGYRPEGLGRMLRKFHNWYKKPLIVVENGICTDDPDVRIQSIKDYLQVIDRVMEEGIPVQGYIHWSTFDNFEWNLGPGYRFGLVAVDPVTKDRRMTRAGEFYAEVTQTGRVYL